VPQPGLLKTFFLICTLLSSTLFLQAQYVSVATDASILRSFTKGSKFWAFGQTVQAQYHVTPKTTAYAWVGYYTTGRFENTLSAIAVDSSVSPQRLDYKVNGSLRYRQISLGLKHYLKGAYNSEATWNLYGITGFGLLMVKATNAYAQPVNETLYLVPQQAWSGSKTIVRLTADVGLGVETMLGAGTYLYTDVRTWIQTTRFRSPYLYNNAVPRVVVVSGGLRILFD
jgi:hypothetical protein